MTVSTTIFELVLALVSVGYDVTKEQVLAHGRKERVALARHTLWYILREQFGWTYEEIAEHTRTGRERFDHGAVVHGVQRLKDLPSGDRRLHLVTKLMSQAAILEGSPPSFENSKGCSLVIENSKTGEVKEAYVEALTRYGNGIKLRINGEQKGRWTSRREWIVLDRVTT